MREGSFAQVGPGLAESGPAHVPIHETDRGVPACRPGLIRHNDAVTEGRHAGARRGPRKPPSLRPEIFFLALATTLAIVAWGYLVYLAIDFGASARDGDGRAWLFLGIASLGAVLCLFLGLVLVARLLRAVGITSSPTDRPAAGSRSAGGRRASR